MNKFQTKGLIILVVIILGAEVFVTIAWGVLLEETSKVFQIFLLVSFEVATYNDNAPVGDAANAATVFQKRMYKSISLTWTETQIPLALCMTEQQFL